VLGAIIGDIVGSRYEFNNTHDKDFKLFDTVLTVATAGQNGQAHFEQVQSAKQETQGSLVLG
jgi:hypothetical protein